MSTENREQSANALGTMGVLAWKPFGTAKLPSQENGRTSTVTNRTGGGDKRREIGQPNVGPFTDVEPPRRRGHNTVRAHGGGWIAASENASSVGGNGWIADAPPALPTRRECYHANFECDHVHRVTGDRPPRPRPHQHRRQHHRDVNNHRPHQGQRHDPNNGVNHRFEHQNHRVYPHVQYPQAAHPHMQHHFQQNGQCYGHCHGACQCQHQY